MKDFFSYHTDIFMPVFLISLTGHFMILGIGGLMSSPAQFSVINAPSSIEVSLVEEQIIPETEIIKAQDAVIENVNKILPEEIVFKKPSIENESIENISHAIENLHFQKVIVKATLLNTSQLVEEKVIIVESVKGGGSQAIELRDQIQEQKLMKNNSQTTEEITSQGAIMEAQPLNELNPAPIYPYLARKKGWEGTVLLKVLVEGDGFLSKIQIARSSGHKTLDDSAFNAIKEWKFKPAQSGKLKFSSWLIIPVEFTLID